MQIHNLNTERQGYYDITRVINNDIKDSKVSSGICVIQVPHTTAGVTINENADPDVIEDMVLGFDRAFPESIDYKHFEGNTTAHLKSSTVGATISIIIENNRLFLGTWQGVYFAEFDGPRSRKFCVQILSNK